MSESKHTPGPWEIAEGDKEGQMVIQETTTGMGLRIAFLGNLGPERTQTNAELLARAPDLLRENEELRAQNAELLEAARKAVAWIWDPEADQLEQFERVAEEFHRATGFLRPGKSEPMALATEERQKERDAAWEKWRRERSSGVINGLRTAIAKAKGGAA